MIIVLLAVSVATTRTTRAPKALIRSMFDIVVLFIDDITRALVRLTAMSRVRLVTSGSSRVASRRWANKGPALNPASATCLLVLFLKGSP